VACRKVTITDVWASKFVWSTLTKDQQAQLSSIAQSRSFPAGYVFRAKLILMLADGASFRTIKQRLQTTAPTIIRWKQRFLASGLDGLDTHHPGQTAWVLTPVLRARILGATRKKPSDGSTHWSCRKLASALRERRRASRPPFKPWMVWTRFCLFRQGVPSVMASSTTGMEPCLCMRR